MGVECLKLQIKITTYYLIYNDFFSLYNKLYINILYTCLSYLASCK